MTESDDALARLMGVGISPDSVGDFDDVVPELPGYEIEGVQGEGGMGTVYKGRRVSLDRQVAIKVMRRAEGSLDRERLLREGKALAQLNHAHIIGVHDLVMDAAGHPCLIMEFVSGGDLAHRLRGGALPLSEALEVFRQCVEAVQAAHQAGIIHRDLKPANILFTEQGQVKVGDFGLAGFQQMPDSLELTLSGTLMGTLDYMSPEQKTGMEQVDERSDIYGLGVLFYEMLSGRRPRGVFAALPHKKCDRLVRRCMQENPKDRYQNCEALLQDLVKIRPPMGKGKLGVMAGLLIVFLGGSGVLFWPDAMPLPQEQKDRVIPVNPTVLPEATPPPTAMPRGRSFPVVTPAVRALPEWEPGELPVVDLLALAAEDFESMRSRGIWRLEDGVLITDRQRGLPAAWISFPQQLPESYELLVEVERTEGVDSIPIFFTTDVGRASFEIDAWREGIGGIQNVDGQDLRVNETRHAARHSVEGMDRILLRVSPQKVEMQVNDGPWQMLELEGHRLSINPYWPVPDFMQVGVGVWQGSAHFQRIELRELRPEL
ncbi:serine/threonine-protein kinase [Kiritimatiellota bacterium B12222]|nr:serine/threonine-protein kinase [Kiritimatiellota bacterium B12222]